MSHIVNQCEFGCGIVGNFICETGESNGEELEKHYKHCKRSILWDKIHELTMLYSTAREEGDDERHLEVTWKLFDLLNPDMKKDFANSKDSEGEKRK